MIKYLLIFSAIFNCILIITLTGIVPFLLFLALCFNIMLFWYIKTLLSKINDINNEVDDMFDMFDSFTKHVEKIYQLELFYGDETIKSLIVHSREVLEEINVYRQKFFLGSEIIDEDSIEEEEEDFDTDTEKEEE
jgi:hypothetical protein